MYDSTETIFSVSAVAGAMRSTVIVNGLGMILAGCAVIQGQKAIQMVGFIRPYIKRFSISLLIQRLPHLPGQAINCKWLLNKVNDLFQYLRSAPYSPAAP